VDAALLEEVAADTQDGLGLAVDERSPMALGKIERADGLQL
jgi:hypothetical protein